MLRTARGGRTTRVRRVCAPARHFASAHLPRTRATVGRGQQGGENGDQPKWPPPHRPLTQTRNHVR